MAEMVKTDPTLSYVGCVVCLRLLFAFGVLFFGIGLGLGSRSEVLGCCKKSKDTLSKTPYFVRTGQ